MTGSLVSARLPIKAARSDMFFVIASPCKWWRILDNVPCTVPPLNKRKLDTGLDRADPPEYGVIVSRRRR